MTMPKTTIGLPVYNGRDTITECLDALAAQTEREFVVKIFDNASTDGTSDICAAFAAKDSRFIHQCNAENLGSAQNFLDALAAGETEYFAWRADDDLSSPDFIERLQAQLDADPKPALAAPHVESRRPAKNWVKQASYVAKWPGVPRVVNVLRQMFFSHPSWIYGLWRTKALNHYYNTTWAKYPTGWANDHLVILNAILDEAVVGDDRCRFIQQIGVRPGGGEGATAGRSPIYEHIAQRREMLHTYRCLCREALEERSWGGLEGAIMRLFIDRYADMRVNASEFKLWRLKMRHRLTGRG